MKKEPRLLCTCFALLSLHVYSCVTFFVLESRRLVDETKLTNRFGTLNPTEETSSGGAAAFGKHQYKKGTLMVSCIEI